MYIIRVKNTSRKSGTEFSKRDEHGIRIVHTFSKTRYYRACRQNIDHFKPDLIDDPKTAQKFGSEQEAQDEIDKAWHLCDSYSLFGLWEVLPYEEVEE